MANIALIGASGNIGREILKEALTRGHTVRGIARNPDKIALHAGLTALRGDLTDVEGTAALVHGAEVLVVSIRWSDNAPQVLDIACKAGVSRLLVVVGAGSLQTACGARVLDTPDFPPAWRPGSEAAARALQILRAESRMNWVAFSPSALIAPGERTGRFRIGGDQLLEDAAGNSRISREDFAMAIVDEIENPQHQRERITVGY